jgi:hypothetical protein
MRKLLRAAAVLAAGTMALTLATPAKAAPDDTSARWLTRQLTDGLIHNDQYGFDDYGLTADTAFALKAIGGQREALRDIRRALGRNVDNWTTFGDDVFAGSTAKAVVLAQTTGADPRDFGGVNLVARLNSLVSADRPTVGRIVDRAANGSDYVNVVGQAYAAQGLAAARSGKADEAVRFLLKQQCAPGYFRLNLADKTAEDQTCDGGDRAGVSAPDTDATAIAVLSLRAVPRQTKAIRTAVRDAAAWLERRQRDNGSFGGGTSTETSNSNSTGVAGWALGEVGACKPAAKAARWVHRLQVSGDVSGTRLAGEKGAIAYDPAALAAARADGIGTPERDQWRRATSQAAPALMNLSVDACRAR